MWTKVFDGDSEGEIFVSETHSPIPDQASPTPQKPTPSMIGSEDATYDIDASNYFSVNELPISTVRSFTA